MIRRLLVILAILALLPSVAVLLLWADSYRHGRSITVAIGRSTTILEFTNGLAVGQTATFAKSLGSPWLSVESDAPSTPTCSQWHGFGCDSHLATKGGIAGTLSVVIVPGWFVALLLALPFMAWLSTKKFIRVRVRRKPGDTDELPADD